MEVLACGTYKTYTLYLRRVKTMTTISITNISTIQHIISKKELELK